MQIYVGRVSEGRPQSLLYGDGFVVHLPQGKVAIHTHVQLYGYLATYLSGSQVMNVARPLLFVHDFADSLLHVTRQTLLHQLAYRIRKNLRGLHHDEHAHHQRRNRVQNGPFTAKQDGTSDSYGRTHGRKRIAAMMPSIGLHSRRIHLARDLPGKVEHPLLQHYAEHCGRQGDNPRAGQFRPVLHHVHYLYHGIVAHHHAHDYQGQSYNTAREGLVFAVPIGVVGVFRLRRDLHEDYDDKVRDEITERMHGIRYHRGTVPQHAGDELKNQKQ